MRRMFVLLTLALVAGLVLVACNDESSGNGDSSNGDKQEYTSDILEITLQENEVSRLVVVMEFGDVEAASRAEELRQLAERAGALTPPDVYREAHETIVQGLKEVASNAELAATAIDAGDESAFEEALTAVNDAQLTILDGLLTIRGGQSTPQP